MGISRVVSGGGGGSGSSATSTITVTAGESLAQYDVVYLDSSDSGKAKKAQCDGTEAEADAIGIVTAAIADDASGDCQIAGELENESWSWTPGAALYVSPTAGSLTETKPTTNGQYVKPIGYAETATKIVIDPDTGWAIGDAEAFVTLTDGATITPDFSEGNNFEVTLGGNRALANPSNPSIGQSGVIVMIQDGTGSRTLSFGSYYHFVGGIDPTLTTDADAVDVISYFVRSATSIICSFMANMG